MESSRNPLAVPVVKEAGWNLLSSLLTSVSKEVMLIVILCRLIPFQFLTEGSLMFQELNDQVFDILAFWASTFSENPKKQIDQSQDLTSDIWLVESCSFLTSSFSSLTVWLEHVFVLYFNN